MKEENKNMEALLQQKTKDLEALKVGWAKA